MRVFRLVAISALVPACVIPYALPPLKAEVGATAIGGAKARGHGGGGTYLASGTLNKQQRFDLGAGGFVDWDDNGVASKTGYVDASAFVERSPRTRTSIGMRGELQWSTARGLDETMTTVTTTNEGPAIGLKLRVEHEYFATAHTGYADADKCVAIAGGAHGVGGVGLFAEAGRAVGLPGDRSAWTATAGVTLRIPSTAGVILGIPGCR